MVQWLGLSAFTAMAQIQPLIGKTNILQGMWHGQKIKKKKKKKEERKEKTCHEKKATIIRANSDIFDYNFLLHRM